MSSTITITFEPEAEGVRRVAWDPWCAEHGVEYSTGNGLYYYRDNVEIDYHSKRRITFSTYWQSLPGLVNVAHLALTFWEQFGGSLNASPELRQLIAAMVRGDA